MEDLPRYGWPSMSSTKANTAKVKEMVNENPHLSLRGIAAALFVSHESVSTILKYFYIFNGHETRCCTTSSERPSHKAIIVNESPAKNSTNITEQLPYSLDMATADFVLFLKLESPLRGTRFQLIENIKENSRRELESFSENVFKKCCDDWIIHWHKYIISGGAYFEGNKINLNEYYIVLYSCLILLTNMSIGYTGEATPRNDPITTTESRV